MNVLGVVGFWVTILVGGLMAFLLRSAFLLSTGWIDDLTERTRAVLALLGPVAIAAIVGPRFIRLDGTVAESAEKVVAGLVAGFVAWRTRSVVATIAVGVATLLLIQALISDGIPT